MASSSTPLAPSTPTTPITVKGRFFWQDDRRFLINGVVYQPHGLGSPLIDPLADDQLHDLERSIPLLKDLGINTIFVYYIDNTNNHDAAMNMLAEAGIYVLPCIAPTHDQTSNLPYGSYRADVIQWYFKAVDNMTKYSNTLGLVISCEFIKDVSKTAAAPILRAIIRDVKKYIRLITRKKNQRALPVGIVVSDQRALLKLQFDYFASEPDKDAIDFFGFNDFFWVGRSSMQESGYNRLLDIFATTPIPVFFSRYGNNIITPRIFHDTHAIYCDFSMLSVFSGGFVFEFFQGALQSGLIERSVSRRSGHLRFTKLTDFRNLRESLRGSFMRLPAIISNSPPSVTLGERPQPPKINELWLAGGNLPKSPVKWLDVEEAIDDSEWVDVGKEILDQAVDDLGSSIKERLKIKDNRP
ncbi:glycoside hydrolase family 72 protein [Annulohypoxylon bovei var. microspora]|nr:glycoside hydrolase family 72 protein [Annulohypoxylon bovei var. microspora]